MRRRCRFRSARDAEAWIWSFVNYELLARYPRTTRTHDLDRFTDRLLAGGWRPGGCRTVHVAGTNGKGTVSHLIERILRAGGVRTGLYTSPHLRSVRERIVLDGRPIGARDFRDGVERLAALDTEPAEGYRTAFEYLTALAFLAFQEAGVEIAVVEVGLGGRLDATNVVPPGLAVITPISLDHQRILGRTVEAIAADKAFVLKRGGRGYLMPQRPTASRALRERLRRERVPWVETAARVHVTTRTVSETGASFHVAGRRDYGTVATRLLGAHQEANIAAAVAVAEDLLPEDLVEGAVRRGLTGARVPGRLHVLRAGGKAWILDGGHNPAAARVVALALARHVPDRRIAGVVGMAADKDHRGFFAPLLPHLDRLLLTRAANPRAASTGLLREAVPSGFRGVVEVPDVAAALERAAASRAGTILVTGSFVVAGEALAALRTHRGA